MKKFIKEYLMFTRKERIAVFTLISLLAFIFFFPSIYGYVRPQSALVNDTAWANAMNKLIVDTGSEQVSITDQNLERPQQDYQFDKTIPAEKGELFYFDPNTITKDQWRRLGLREKTIETIQNYIAKGGKFNKPEDLKKIYGLNLKHYDRLLPYIKIEGPHDSEVYNRESLPKGVTTFKNNSTTGFEIHDINTADTSDFIKLPGIGSKLAARIVNFRDKLGGFYSVDQVKETYGIADSVFQKIKTKLHLGNTLVKTININNAELDDLKSHPYFKYDISKAIINYRKEHGAFTLKEDIRKVMVVTNEVYIKIAPYLTIQ